MMNVQCPIVKLSYSFIFWFMVKTRNSIAATLVSKNISELLQQEHKDT